MCTHSLSRVLSFFLSLFFFLSRSLFLHTHSKHTPKHWKKYTVNTLKTTELCHTHTLSLSLSLFLSLSLLLSLSLSHTHTQAAPCSDGVRLESVVAVSVGWGGDGGGSGEKLGRHGEEGGEDLRGRYSDDDEECLCANTLSGMG